MGQKEQTEIQAFLRKQAEMEFWAQVKQTEKCWHWTGRKDSYGHGLTYWRGRQATAHRVSWLITNGTPPDGPDGYVRQWCGVNDCVRPDHLFIGHQSGRVDMETLMLRVAKIPGPLPTECWEWQAGKIPEGYGTVKYEKKDWLAHRLSWTFTNGPIPEGKKVCHHCDNPSCINPDHLFVGTDKDNRDDMIAKGRQRFPNGVDIRRAKLDDDKVRAIRAEWTGAYGQLSKLGRKYGVTHVCIQAIVRGETWKHVKPLPPASA